MEEGIFAKSTYYFFLLGVFLQK